MSLDNEYTDAAEKFKNGGKIAKTSQIDNKIFQETLAAVQAQLSYETEFNSRTTEKLQALALVKIAEQLEQLLKLIGESK